MQLLEAVYVGAYCEENWCLLVRSLQELFKVELRDLHEVLAKEMYDKGANLLHQLVRMEAAHDAQAHQVFVQAELFLEALEAMLPFV